MTDIKSHPVNSTTTDHSPFDVSYSPHGNVPHAALDTHNPYSHLLHGSQGKQGISSAVGSV